MDDSPGATAGGGTGGARAGVAGAGRLSRFLPFPENNEICWHYIYASGFF